MVTEIFGASFYENTEIDWRRVKWKGFLAFEVYGVKIGIRSNNLNLIENFKAGLPALFPVKHRLINFEAAAHNFSFYLSSRHKSKNVAYQEQTQISNGSFSETDFEQLESKIRLTVAEFAEKVIFLHAGVVEYKGRALVIPGKSFTGKTTLVAELASRGLKYYSDEFAVIDRSGRVHPYPKKLSVRGIIDDYQQVDIDVEALGGKKGRKKLEVGIILISTFKKGAKFKINEISIGSGIIEAIANSVSIRQNPEFVLKVLSQITKRAKIYKTQRNEAKLFADRLLAFLEQLN
jgi:hypothetical protein